MVATSPATAWTDTRDEISFFVRGVPRTQGSKKAFWTAGGKRPKFGRVDVKSIRAFVVDDNDAELKNWRSLVNDKATDALGCNLPAGRDLALGVDLTFYLVRPQSGTLKEKRRQFQRKMPDPDKLGRSCLDSFTGVVYVDDAQVADLHVRKLFAGEQPPGVAIRVWVAER